jgi:hypothetical protein
MKTDNNPARLSQILAAAISNVYKLGGLALTFVFAGTLLLLVAVILGTGLMSYVIAAVGASLILAVVALFYQRDIGRLRDARHAVLENAELIDSVQRTAVNMTEFASNLQALAFRYADSIAQLITSQREEVRAVIGSPPISLLPGAGKLAERLTDNKYVVRASDLSSAIVRTTESAKTVIEEVGSALAKSDPAALKKYVNQIGQLNDEVRGLLAS